MVPPDRYDRGRAALLRGRPSLDPAFDFDATIAVICAPCVSQNSIADLISWSERSTLKTHMAVLMLMALPSVR
jgi:hypothetical protein